MSPRIRIALLCGVLAPGLAAGGGPPHILSPGSPEGSAIADACPTFSWALAPDAVAYELAVYRLTEAGPGSRPIVRRELPAAAAAWTPSLDHCLDEPGWYAWSLRSVGAEEAGGWSAPLVFELLAGPNAAELERIVAHVLERLAESGAVRGPASPEPVVTGPAATRAASPSDAAPAAGAVTPAPGDAAAYFEHGDETGVHYGMHGITFSASPGAAGVVGEAVRGSFAQAAGVHGLAHSVAGIAGVFDNTAGGKVLIGKGSGGTEVFSVDGGSAVTAVKSLSAETASVEPSSDGFGLRAENDSALFPAAYFEQRGTGALIEGFRSSGEVFRVTHEGVVVAPSFADRHDAAFQLDPSGYSRLWQLQIDDVVHPGTLGALRLDGALWAYKLVDWNETLYGVDPASDSRLRRLDVTGHIADSDSALLLDDDVDVGGGLTAASWDFGCGATYLPLATCPGGGSDGPSCDEVPVGGLCESDGECGTSQDLDNCPGGYDWYVKTSD